MLQFQLKADLELNGGDRPDVWVLNYSQIIH